MGIYYDLPDEQYRSMQGLSQSRLKRLQESGYAFLDNPVYNEKALRIGSLTDMMTLQPHLVTDNFVIPPDYSSDPGNVTADGKKSSSKRTGYVKQRLSEFASRNKGKTFIDPDEWDTASTLAHMVREKKFFKDFLADETGSTQVAFDGEINGVHCKGLADGCTSNMLFDLKTTIHSGIKQFRSSAWKFGYIFQLRFYYELLLQNGYDFPMDNCYIIAAGKQTPHDVTVFRIPVQWMDEAYDQILLLTERFKRLQSEGSFEVGQDFGAEYIYLNEDLDDGDIVL